MNILYIGKTCSFKTASILLDKTGVNPGFQIIKFSQLILNGFAKNDVGIEVISNAFQTNSIFTKARNENDGNILYHFVPTFRIPILGQLLYFITSLIFTLNWALRTKGNKIIFSDIFASSSISNGSMFAAKLLKIKTCALVTDMIITPVTTKKDLSNAWWKLFFHLRNKSLYNSLKRFDSFVYLTKYMNDVYNPYQKPFIVMEGSVDSSFYIDKGINITNNNVKTIMYAGAIEAEYGFNELIKAFMSLPNDDIELHIYGDGKFVTTLNNYQKQDKRIKYHGIVDNKKIVEEEIKATLLVNPRLTHEEFVKYSFPSKTSEYMVSGTPLLTTKLPGIPDEYFQYLFTFEEENVKGFAQKISEVISLPKETLIEKGKMAQHFMLKNKNNIVQAKKILLFFKQVLASEIKK